MRTIIYFLFFRRNKQYNGQRKKGQKDKQRSTSIMQKTKDRTTRTPLTIGGELVNSGVREELAAVPDPHVALVVLLLLQAQY